MPAIRRFAEIPVPTVAAVQGLCLAAGLEVALSCDLIWAAEGCPARSRGGSDRGHAVRRRDAAARRAGGRRPGRRGGADRRAYPAETMLEWGVVNRVVPAGDLLEKARAFAAAPGRAARPSRTRPRSG